MNIKRLFLFLSVVGLLCGTHGCTRHEIETRSQIQVAPIEVKPIHITIDVNVRVERALDDVFKDIDEAQAHETIKKGGDQNAQ